MRAGSGKVRRAAIRRECYAQTAAIATLRFVIAPIR
jgi:hypothetical protein